MADIVKSEIVRSLLNINDQKCLLRNSDQILQGHGQKLIKYCRVAGQWSVVTSDQKFKVINVLLNLSFNDKNKVFKINESCTIIYTRLM